MQIQPIIRPMQEFGPCLKQLLQEKGISASELARSMAYKSRNSIFRILDGVGAHSARQAFYDRLLEGDPLRLGDHERAALEQALEISRVGLKAFLSNRAMRELLMNERLEETAEMIFLSQDGNDRKPFEQFMEGINGIKELSITITGCCERQIFAALDKYLRGADAQCRIRITHFVYTGEEEIIRNISAIQPVLYRPDYTAYTIEPGVFSREKQRMYRNNCVFVHARDREGVWRNRSLILADKGVFLLIKSREAGGFATLDQCFERDLQRMRPLKTAVGQDGADYLAYTESCRRLEQNRAIYMIKQDVPISYVHTEILERCVREGLARAGTAQGEELEPPLKRLRDVHNQRFDNFFGKRKPTHTIFSCGAMERFARTGKQSDHFFAFRPYTPQERVSILAHLRVQAQENPHFHVHFFKPEYEAPQMEIALYEGAGTLMAKPNTHYDLDGDHAEALIEQDEFCESYKTYFAEDLLERHVLDPKETLAVLDRLIELAKEA